MITVGRVRYPQDMGLGTTYPGGPAFLNKFRLIQPQE